MAKNKLTCIEYKYPVIATVGADVTIDPRTLEAEELVSIRGCLMQFRDSKYGFWDAPVFPLTIPFDIHLEYAIALGDSGEIVEDTYIDVHVWDDTDMLPEHVRQYADLNDLFEFVAVCERAMEKDHRLCVDCDLYYDRRSIDDEDLLNDLDLILDRMSDKMVYEDGKFIDLVEIYKEDYENILRG